MKAAIRTSISAHRVEFLAAMGLLCLYLAVMSGHLMSVDGLVMWRQALALAYHHSLSFVPPIWWGGTITESSRGLGASIQYLPGLFLLPWVASHVPVQGAPEYDFRLIYDDVLYRVAGAPVWALITAVTAYLVGLTSRALGADRRVSLWAMAFYGLGSPALAASRGDYPQPLVALCWIAGLWACLRFNQSGGRRWLWISAISVSYGVLARPLEGSYLLSAVLLLLSPRWRNHIWAAAGQVGAWLAAVAVTLWINWVRFGSPIDFGYRLGTPEVSWTTPIWNGIPNALLSPGRGVLWEFPALVLSALGAILLWKIHKRAEALVFAGVPTVLFLESCQLTDWVGGWDWGFRFFQPALPLVAVLAGFGIAELPSVLRGWLPAAFLACGFIWNVPAVATDILGGYGLAYSGGAANWRLDAYPPIGAWGFLHHVQATSWLDSAAVDVVWFRATHFVGVVALVPFIVLIGSAAALLTSAARVEFRGGVPAQSANSAAQPLT